MNQPNDSALRSIKTFPQLVKYLRDELEWPIESEKFDDLSFEFTADELGIDPKTAAKIQEIKQLRPLTTNQPWGVFFVKFEPKKLPIVALRKILSRLVFKKRASANKAERAAWNLRDLLFISAIGEGADRQINLAHFSEGESGDLPVLRVIDWDEFDTALKLRQVEAELRLKLHWPGDPRHLDAWRRQWSGAFALRPRQIINTAKDLAIRLADLARAIRVNAEKVLSIETEKGRLRKLHLAFQKALIHDLSEEDFADMYAQTITYGLFSAAVSRTTPDGGTKVLAEDVAGLIPVTNPFLKETLETFLTVGGRRGKFDFDELGIQEVVELLNNRETSLDAVLRDFGNRGRGEDPVIHFYEDFLRVYDKKRKVQRGVFYTPQPVVSYIIRSVHELLQTEFGLEDGLASTVTWGEMAKRSGIQIPEGTSPDAPFVTILDPATGTATFLVEVIDVIYRTMKDKWTKAKLTQKEIDVAWNDYVPKHLLPRLYGYELMMAPYAIAHMKIGLKLTETGYRFLSDERVRIYLTNSLEPPQDVSGYFEEMAPALAHEAAAVNEVKRGQSFTIIVGNPPYSKSSGNRSRFAEELVEEYKRLVQGETNVQPLSDDYVKFIACSLRISHAALSIIGLITNRSYLDGLIHRGLRSEFLRVCSGIRVIDLHGDSNVGEQAPSDRANENVFDITQGVCITIGVKRTPRTRLNSVLYEDVWGTREEKYQALFDGVSDTQIRVQTEAPYYFFVPKDLTCTMEQRGWVSMDRLFKVSGMGVKSRRDHFLIDQDREALRARFDRLIAVRDVEKHRDEFVVTDNDQWTLSAMQALVRRERGRTRIVPLLYRPFDSRFVWYHKEAIERGDARWPVMKHVLPNQLSLLTSRQSANAHFTSVFIARGLSEMKAAESTRGSYAYPVSLRESELDLRSQRRETNIRAETLEGTLADKSPEQILFYVYAILHSPKYRCRYSQILRIEFPRVPNTCPESLAAALIQLGSELVALHLLESPKVEELRTEFVGRPKPVVEKVSWLRNTVWIDKAQTTGFKGVAEQVWKFHIGGYQVCEKWLKDRKGRTLSTDDIARYHKIVVALAETIRLMGEIDKVIDQHGGWPGAFATATPADERPS